MTTAKTSQPLAASATSRRDFLTKTALFAAAGTVVAGCAQPDGYLSLPKGNPQARPSLGPDDTINIAILGTGGMGSGHAGRLIALANEGRCNARVVALCDVCKPRLDACWQRCKDNQQKEGDIDRYRDYKEVLARDDIHAVLIASPEHWHAQMAIDAIHAGKDIYCEKPMTLRFHETVALREVVMNSDAIFQVGTQHIMQPKYQEAKKLLAQQVIGHPTLSQTSYCRNSIAGEWTYYGIDPKVVPGEMLDWKAWCGPLGVQPWDPAVYARWRRYRKYSTGIIGDLLVHQMTPMIYAIDPGWPTRVTATGGHYVDKAMENHDQVNICVEYEKDHSMLVIGSTCNEVGLETMVRGHKANMRLGGSNVVVRPERIFVDDIDPIDVQAPHVADQDLLRLNWLECIRTRKEAMSNIDLATKVMAVVDMATMSMWEGGAFAFDHKSLKISKL
jgi:predicted dehydrogenase